MDDDDGGMTPSHAENMAMNQKTENEIRREGFDDIRNVCKGQLEVRYKRFREQIATIQELVQKVSISVGRLEGENQSLREQSEYYHRRQGQENPGDKTSTDAVRCLSAARVAIKLLQLTVGRMKDKMKNFEEIALADKDRVEETLRQYDQIKTKLEEVNHDLKVEKKKNQECHEKINFLENQFVKEATKRIAAERRSYSLENQVRELADELSAQSSQICERTGNVQPLSSDTEHSPVSNDHVVSSTPHTSPAFRTINASNDVRKASWKRTSKFTSRFQSVFSDMEDRFHKLKNKVKTFAELINTNTQESLAEHTKHFFDWTLHKASHSRSITEN